MVGTNTEHETDRALLAKINRRLWPDGSQALRTLDPGSSGPVADLYLVNPARGAVMGTNLDLDELATELDL